MRESPTALIRTAARATERVCVSERLCSWGLASARSIGGDPVRRGEAFRGLSYGLGHPPISRRASNEEQCRECLALWEKISRGRATHSS